MYELQGQRWVDQGTAFCFGHYDEAANEDLSLKIVEKALLKRAAMLDPSGGGGVSVEPSGVDAAAKGEDKEVSLPNKKVVKKVVKKVKKKKEVKDMEIEEQNVSSQCLCILLFYFFCVLDRF